MLVPRGRSIGKDLESLSHTNLKILSSNLSMSFISKTLDVFQLSLRMGTGAPKRKEAKFRLSIIKNIYSYMFETSELHLHAPIISIGICSWVTLKK